MSDIMEFFNTSEIDIKLLRYSWTIPLSTLILSMSIHWFSGDARTFLIYISEADYPGLQRIVFTTGLTITGLIYSFLSYKIYLNFEDTSPRKFLLIISTIGGVYIGINLVAMSFLDMYDHFSGHILTALTVFYGGMIWGLAIHFSLPKSSTRIKSIRIGSILLSVLGFITMTVAYNRAAQELGKAVILYEEMNLVQHPYLDIAAIGEYALVFGFFMILFSIELDVKKINDS
ncbi:MAG: hypothetical protein VXX39_00100 [Candidatus Thermoplasmatota archaeon]|nr:hypothetical protein [Candidatus Thermoplasmatota archaeon]